MKWPGVMMSSDFLIGPPSTPGGFHPRSVLSAPAKTDRALQGSRAETAREGRCRMTTEHPATDEDLQLIREAMSEKGPDDRAAAFHEDSLDSSRGETVEQERKIHFVLSTPQDLGSRKTPSRFLGGHDYRRSRVVEHMGAFRRLAVGIEHDPQRIPTLRVFRFDRELRVVHQDRSDTDENRIGFGPE